MKIDDDLCKPYKLEYYTVVGAPQMRFPYQMQAEAYALEQIKRENAPSFVIVMKVTEEEVAHFSWNDRLEEYVRI